MVVQDLIHLGITIVPEDRKDNVSPARIQENILGVKVAKQKGVQNRVFRGAVPVSPRTYTIH